MDSCVTPPRTTEQSIFNCSTDISRPQVVGKVEFVMFQARTYKKPALPGLKSMRVAHLQADEPQSLKLAIFLDGHWVASFFLEVIYPACHERGC